jgi:hypothetical protein
VSRHERFGFGRVVLTGAGVWLLVAVHLLLAMLLVLATGVVVLAGWRWLGAMLRCRLEQPPRWWRL